MKKEIGEKEYLKIIKENGGIENLTVFGVYTELEGEVSIKRDRIMSENEIYTEWGKRTSENPLVASLETGTFAKPKWKFYKF